MPKIETDYTNNGVYITPSEFSSGDRIRLMYNGLLSQSGASDVYAHVGYGTQDWKDITDIKMTKTSEGFEATFPLTSASKLNVAFKDSANNWDNNSGNNYSFEIK